MKIAFFVSNYPVVSETFINRQIAGMISRGHEVEVIAGEYDSAAADPLNARAKISQVRPAGGGPRKLAAIGALLARTLWSPTARRQLAAALAAARNGYGGPLVDIASTGGRHLGSYDAVVAHFGPAGVRAMYLREAGVFEGPIATVFHGFEMSERAVVDRYLTHYRRLFSKTELMLPISRLWRDRLIGWGAPPERVAVQRMGVDLDPTEPVTGEPPQRPLRILSVARLVEKKGLAHAVAGVAKAAAPVDYAIIGSGPLESALRVDASTSPHPIRFLGARPHADVFAELARADVFLLPSIVAENGDMEGVPVSLMEAMARGVIVLATRHSGIPELIEDGVTGLLVDEKDADGIARALDRIASSDLDLPAMRRAARAKVETEFNNATLEAELETRLRELKRDAERTV